MPIGKFPSDMHGMRHGHIDGVPYFRFWCQKTLPALYDDSLSYYDLLTNVVWYINQLITVAKAYDEKFAELEGLYIELEHYVATYFDKLNVEQTVADILNDMAYSGRLTDIMCTYINDYSIDAKKIKNGFVPVHYEFVKCDENNDYYKRDLTDKEMVEALRHGSILLGVFNGSPQFGNFIMFHDTAEYEYNGQTVECKCGCSCEHLVQNYKVTYREAMANKNGKLVMYIITDEYCKQYATGYYGQMYADVEDGSITADKLADGAVTHPKLADDSVWSNNIKDGEVKTPDLADGAVTHPKLADDAVWANNIKDGEVTFPKLYRDVPARIKSLRCRKFVFISDSYGAGLGGVNSWIDSCANMMRLESGQWYKNALNGSGFIGQSGVKNFETLLREVNVPANDKVLVTDIVVCGGWNDQGKDESALLSAMNSFTNYAKTNFPNAYIHIGYIAHMDDAKVKANGASHSAFNLWAGAGKYSNLAGKAGMGYIGNSEHVLHRWDYFQNDGVHPSNLGQEEIASFIATYLLNGNADVVRGFEVITDTVTYASGVSSHNSPVISTWQENGKCGLWYNGTGGAHFTFSTPVNFSGHPSDDSHGVGTKTLFTIPENSYVQGGQYSGMQVLLTATYKTSGENRYETRPTYVRLKGKDVCIIPISSNETAQSNPYDTLENISDVIFQVGTIRIEGESLFC